ncbi:MAG: tetratricopeptide repeat protein [Bacteroidota bacterium]|nr:tetratricopeptide repeat protein [Bacteroidota bacterium]
MKRYIPLGILAAAIAYIVTTGFQCSSAELTSARLYIQRKDYPKAVAQLEKEVTKNPKSEEGYYLLGAVRAEMKDYRKMKDAFDKALAIDSAAHAKDIHAQEVSAWVHLFNQGVDALNNATDLAGYGKAVDAFSTGIYVLPESTMTYRNLGLTYYRANIIDSAVMNLTAALDKSHDEVACHLLGEIYIDSASALKSRFMNTNRDVFTAMKNLAAIHEKMKAADVKYILGEPSSVKDLAPKKKKRGAAEVKEEWMYDKYNLVLTINGENISAVTYTMPYAPTIDSTDLKNAVAFYDKAAEISRRGIAWYPDNASISENLMNAYIGAERNDEARQLLVTRVKKYPESKFDHYNLGVFLLKDSNYVDAIAQFKETLRLDSLEATLPDTAKTSRRDTSLAANALYNLAASYVNWGVAEQEKTKAKAEAEGKEGREGKEDTNYKEKFKLALPYLEEVVKSKGNDVQMWELLGQVYANLNQQDKAVEAYKKADAIREGKQ